MERGDSERGRERVCACVRRERESDRKETARERETEREGGRGG